MGIAYIYKSVYLFVYLEYVDHNSNCINITCYIILNVLILGGTFICYVAMSIDKSR